MITQIRVDDRLIHGQVAVVWTKELNAPLLVVANDEAAKNEITQMTLKMAVPNGMKLLIRSVEESIKLFNDPRAKDKRIFVIVNSVKDACAIAKEVPDLEAVNVANVCLLYTSANHGATRVRWGCYGIVAAQAW